MNYITSLQVINTLPFQFYSSFTDDNNIAQKLALMDYVPQASFNFKQVDAHPLLNQNVSKNQVGTEKPWYAVVSLSNYYGLLYIKCIIKNAHRSEQHGNSGVLNTYSSLP